MDKITDALETLLGTIERITFHNRDTGFCVLRVKVRGQKDLIAVTATALDIQPGEYIRCEGSWHHDKQYGLQFKAVHIKNTQPTSLEGIQKYLASGMIKGIGPHYAKALVNQFGETVFEILDKQPEKLCKVAGIGQKRQKIIVQAWQTQKVIRDIMLFLQSHGVGVSRAAKIYKVYGQQAIEKIKADPYQLVMDIHGIGFKTADQLAQRLGIEHDSILRARAGICHTLQEWASKGHTAAPYDTLLENAMTLLEIPETILRAAIADELAKENLIRETIDETIFIYLKSFYFAEEQVAKQLKKLLSRYVPWGEINTDEAINWLQKHSDITLSPSQITAIVSALQSKVMIITGGPGVGKTTVLNSLLKILLAKKIRLALCAPTGRAAKRLSEVTGVSAQTIHRLLRYEPQSRGFQYHQDNPLPYDLIVMDESSMLDITLTNHFLKAIHPNSALFFVGDVDQLPSVGPGAILADLIASKRIPCVKLTDIFRQAADSKIITNAHRINHGIPPDFDTTTDAETDFYFIPGETPEAITQKLLSVVCDRLPKRFHYDPIEDIQVLTPMNRGGIGAQTLNHLLQATLNPNPSHKVTRYGTTFAVNDKVIQKTNNYDKDIFNGDVGKIVAIDEDESELLIHFEGREIPYDFNDLDEIGLAYAISIHKSQGSEYPVVVLPIAMQHYTLLERNLLYTGITRGKKHVILIGEKRAIIMATKRETAKKRVTHLAKRLQNE